ncbi:HAD family hydrolase [Kribbella sp. NPDC058693]|uniref:HAD family hydrolase n=1 Tax=Kribbella sp. NPDC058693 TaxID=3346602 RepID=UPI0036523499
MFDSPAALITDRLAGPAKSIPLAGQVNHVRLSIDCLYFAHGLACFRDEWDAQIDALRRGGIIRLGLSQGERRRPLGEACWRRLRYRAGLVRPLSWCRLRVRQVGEGLMSRTLAVFFDIGDTLASAVMEGTHLSRLDVYPFVPEVLARLRAGDVAPPAAVGLISNTGSETAVTMNKVLGAAGLLALVDAELCLFSSVEGVNKTQPEMFERARDRMALPASRCIFVGEDLRERRTAESVGFGVSPHPLHALHMVAADFAVPPQL